MGSSVDLSPENYFFANATTLYVADGGQPKAGTVGDGGLQKWTLNTTTGVWTLDYTLSAGLNLVQNTASRHAGTTGLIGLTGVLNANGTVTFFATNSTIGDLDQTYLYTITDTVSATTAAAGESFHRGRNRRAGHQCPRRRPGAVRAHHRHHSSGQSTSAGRLSPIAAR